MNDNLITLDLLNSLKHHYKDSTTIPECLDILMNFIEQTISSKQLKAPNKLKIGYNLEIQWRVAYQEEFYEVTVKVYNHIMTWQISQIIKLPIEHRRVINGFLNMHMFNNKLSEDQQLLIDLIKEPEGL